MAVAAAYPGYPGPGAAAYPVAAASVDAGCTFRKSPGATPNPKTAKSMTLFATPKSYSITGQPLLLTGSFEIGRRPYAGVALFLNLLRFLRVSRVDEQYHQVPRA